MYIRSWGVRGSITSSGIDAVKYGGNTSCYEIRANKQVLIFDAGTGIRNLGRSLATEGVRSCNLLFTHTHWDHVEGLPYFEPIYDPDFKINIFVPYKLEESIDQAIKSLFSKTFHPVELSQLSSRITINTFSPDKPLFINDIKITVAETKHSCVNYAYRIEYNDSIFVYTGDHEGNLKGTPGLYKLVNNADILLADAMYTSEDYRAGWGHSYYTQWIEDCISAGVKKLYFTHHNASYTDLKLEQINEDLSREYSNRPISLKILQENYTITKDKYLNDSVPDLITSLQNFSLELSDYNDTGIILDKILAEARKNSNADAGTIYLHKDGKLHFAYVHNDTLFSADSVSKFIYSNATLEINESTIAGYTAYHFKPLIVDDVYTLDNSTPYHFNRSFDDTAHYRTQSMLVVPIVSRNHNKTELLGVIQLINKKNRNGDSIPFELYDKARLEMLATYAASAIKRSLLISVMTLRMLSLTTLKDPKETEGHFLRVGAYSVEIFHRWAQKRGHDIDSIKNIKDKLSIASMLHDIGKVGIPDAVMLKPGKLTDEEYAVMKKHTFMGSQIYNNSSSLMDEMIRNISMHHHERWDGKGYGNPDAEPLKGEDIPWEARITAIADVFDALSSARVYKSSWGFEESINEIKKNAGTQFDPEMVDAFLEIEDTIQAIFNKYMVTTC